ncbi:MAG TPA: hypothetical protein VNG12_10635, partial [Acidimicrobiales bacterium]|nr:hypothetical protein [Acidimicrobiales bacterium]
ATRQEMRHEGVAHGEYPTIGTLVEREKEVDETVIQLNAEMLRLLDDLEEPVPPKPRWRRRR